MGAEDTFPSLSICKHEGFQALNLFPFLEGYRQPYFLHCTLSRQRSVASRQLPLIERFALSQRPSSLTLRVYHNLRPEIVSLLRICDVEQFEITPAGFSTYKPGLRWHPHSDYAFGICNQMTSFTASSPCMFTSLGRRIILAIANGKAMKELSLSNTSISPQDWEDMLSRLFSPCLTKFTIQGQVTHTSIRNFLTRHRVVKEVHIGDCVRSPSKNFQAYHLPKLRQLRVPSHSVLIFLPGTCQIEELHVNGYESGDQDGAQLFRLLEKLPSTTITDLHLDISQGHLTHLCGRNITRFLQRLEGLSIYLHALTFPDWFLVSVISNTDTVQLY